MRWPLGPKWLQLNATAASAGMALFFTLSGYLIPVSLLTHPSVGDFLIRRGCRILPAFVVVQGAALLLGRAGPEAWAANLLFLVNYWHEHLSYNPVVWSLCVEVHFYLLVAVMAGVIGRTSLFALPALGLAVTAARVYTGNPTALETHLRADEILAGATLALATRPGCRRPPGWLTHPGVWAGLLAVAASPHGGPLQYTRPYAAALLVGATLDRPGGWVGRWLRHQVLAWLARVSYALYLIHTLTLGGWLGDGPKLTLYLVKRPISFLIMFSLAYLSTVTWERW